MIEEVVPHIHSNLQGVHTTKIHRDKFGFPGMKFRSGKRVIISSSKTCFKVLKDSDRGLKEHLKEAGWLETTIDIIY